MTTDKPTAGEDAPEEAPQAEVLAEDADREAPASDEPAPDEPAGQGGGSGGRGAAVVGGIALVLGLSALGGGAYLWQEQQNLLAAQDQLRERQASAVERSELPSLQPFDSSAIEASVEGLEAKVESVDVGLAATRRGYEEYRAQNQADMERMALRNADVMERVVEIGRTNRDDWRLAEVEYLLRLAHQRVVMGGELLSAEALLADADNVLFELNMAGLLQVRRQVASDLAAVRAAAELDVTGIYLQLDVLQEQLEQLTFFGTEAIEAGPSQVSWDGVVDSDDWRATLARSWEQIVLKFRELVVVQKRDDEIEPLMTAVGQAMIRLQMGLKIEQAKHALLLQRGEIYQSSLDGALDLAVAHFALEDPASVAFVDALGSLRHVNVEPVLPDIAGSQQAIRAFIDAAYASRNQVSPLTADEAAADEEALP